jgi:RHS repeat-associated protein
LFSPYGGSRYSSGTSPTTFAFTGQRADAASGLDYDNARYYDPVAGQFGSADTILDGLNRYGYVGGNPATLTDPSGHSAPTMDPGAAEADEAAPPVVFNTAPPAAPQVPATAPQAAPTCIGFCMAAGAAAGAAGVGSALSQGGSPAPSSASISAAHHHIGVGGPISETDATTTTTPPTPPTPTGGGHRRTPRTPPAVQQPLPGLGGGGQGAGMPPSTVGSGDPCDKSEAGKTYQTYTVTHQSGKVYSGKASGTGSPSRNIAKRFSTTNPAHSAKGPGWGTWFLDRSSDSLPAIRGREQQLMDYYESYGLKAPENKINGIDPDEGCLDYYLAAATAEFGDITDDPRLG